VARTLPAPNFASTAPIFSTTCFGWVPCGRGLPARARARLGPALQHGNHLEEPTGKTRQIRIPTRCCEICSVRAQDPPSRRPRSVGPGKIRMPGSSLGGTCPTCQGVPGDRLPCRCSGPDGYPRACLGHILRAVTTPHPAGRRSEPACARPPGASIFSCAGAHEFFQRMAPICTAGCRFRWPAHWAAVRGCLDHGARHGSKFRGTQRPPSAVVKGMPCYAETMGDHVRSGSGRNAAKFTKSSASCSPNSKVVSEENAA